MPIQSIDEGLQQRLVRVIIRFGEPEIFTFRLAEPQVPLFEGMPTLRAKSAICSQERIFRADVVG